MQKDYEEYNIGVLDIYGFEIFQVRPVSKSVMSEGDVFPRLARSNSRQWEKKKKGNRSLARFYLHELFMYLYQIHFS